MSTTAPTSYDDFPYPVYVFPQTHPDRLSAIAAVLGLSPPPVERCRVLELGCASGSNLIPMAEGLPQGEFLGIDLSQRQIAEGQKHIAELGLRNIQLRHQSILDFELDAQSFDYVICHGVYSWVPPAVQEGILEICHRCLHPDGIAFISYNTLPGWHMRGMIRDMMLYHSSRFTDARQKVAQSRALLDFIAASVTIQNNPYGQFLRSELDVLCRQPDAYLYHDHLEEYNTPLYFHHFVEQAAAHQLRYLSDVDLPTMEISIFPPHIRDVLARLGADLVQREQYVDFIRNRSFRQSLLCHARHEPKYRLQTDRLTRFFVASPLRPCSANVDVRSAANEQFQTPAGAQVSSGAPMVKAALTILAEEWPRLVAFPELCRRARAKLAGPAADEAADEQLAMTLLRLYTTVQGVIDLRLRPLPLPLVSELGDQPVARPLARWQARNGQQVTNLRHEMVSLSELSRQVLLRLDGQCSQATLLRQLAELVQEGRLTLQTPVAGPQQVELLLRRGLVEQFAQFGRQSLLLEQYLGQGKSAIVRRCSICCSLDSGPRT